MAETTPDPHIANGLRLLAAAYLEKAAKEGEQQQGTKLPEHGDDATS
jgi:hypothetical protein